MHAPSLSSAKRRPDRWQKRRLARDRSNRRTRPTAKASSVIFGKRESRRPSSCPASTIVAEKAVWSLEKQLEFKRRQSSQA
ncbi:unnamed protein product [Prunus armeniaca]|uniref:Uncharacterized protein n=1 Tax=Prunus armeniaca TaxID=36596 RepID=A0A6J5TP22_PRUAR|nr:unnamed protein product [Prunus armeniaca]